MSIMKSLHHLPWILIILSTLAMNDSNLGSCSWSAALNYEKVGNDEGNGSTSRTEPILSARASGKLDLVQVRKFEEISDAPNTSMGLAKQADMSANDYDDTDDSSDRGNLMVHHDNSTTLAPENKGDEGEDETVDEGEAEAEEKPSASSIRAYNGKGAIVCYFGAWSTYRKNGGKFTPDMIDPYLCTHLIYSFTGLKNDEITLLDPWADLTDGGGLGFMMKMTKMKQTNPKLKVLVAIGGWGEGSKSYSQMVVSRESRKKFIRSVMKLLGEFNFDGLDIDWEYPSDRGGDKADKVNFISLLRELRRSFKAKKYLISCAVSSARKTINSGYDVKQMSKYVDMINIMTYDFHGSWERTTGHHTPLYKSNQHDLSTVAKHFNVDSAVKYWIKKGAKPSQIILGLAFYGKSFTLNDGSKNGINAPASAGGREGPYTGADGTLSYMEICEYLKNDTKSGGKSWTIERDPDYKAPYAYNVATRQWVGYDDKESIRLKTRYAKSLGLGGVMMWSIDMDDFRGYCHGERFPLLNAIKRAYDEPEGEGDGGGRRNGESPASTPAPDGPAGGDQPPVCGSNGQWFFPGPTKRQYYDCRTGNGPSLNSCPGNKIWNQELRDCVPNGSGGGGGGGGNSDPDPETDTEIPEPGRCKSEGLLVNPKKCSQFSVCIKSPDGDSFAATKFTCSKGTCLNPKSFVCE